MKYPKATVIAGLEKIIAEKAEWVEARQQEETEAEARHVALYERETRPRLIELLDELRAWAEDSDVRLTRDQIMTVSLDPDHRQFDTYWGWPKELAFHERRKNGTDGTDGTHGDASEEKRLLAFLRSVEDDVVSSHGIEQAGFRPSLLTPALLRGAS